jgi:hypothetical protein
LLDTLNLSSVYTVRDIVINDTIGINCASNLAKTFFDANVDPYFRSTITEARIYMALYKSFQNEIDDSYLKYALVQDFERINDRNLSQDIDMYACSQEKF